MMLQPCTVCGEPGAWSCANCGAKCARHVLRFQKTRAKYRCLGCQGEAGLLRVRRADLTTFDSRLRPALIGVLSGRPLLSAVACGLTFVLAGMSGITGALGVLLGFLLTLVFGIAQLRAAASDTEFDWTAFADPLDELVMPLARALLVGLPAFVVVHYLVYNAILFPLETAATQTSSVEWALVTGWSFWVAALSCVAYAPLALLHATVTSDWGATLNPVKAVKSVLPWRRDLGKITAVAAGLFLAAFLFEWLLPRGPLGSFVAGIGVALSSFAICRALGELVRLHPEEFGWGQVDESWVDLGDPDAPEIEAAPVEPARKQGSVISSYEGQVTAALDAKDAPLAVKLFQAVEGADSQLSPATLTRIGQAAAALEAYSVALSALLAAAKPDVPESGRPLIIAGKILDERLRDHTGAKRIFQQALRRFPGTPAGDYARQQLLDPRFIAVRESD